MQSNFAVQSSTCGANRKAESKLSRRGGFALPLAGFLRAAGVTLVIILSPGPTTAAQVPVPTPQELLELRQNPDLIRQRIRESGLTAEQIRASLRAAGYPDNLLDAYLIPGTGTDLPPTQAQLSALQALGLPFSVARAALAPDTGFVSPRVPPQRSRVFGVDAFRRATTQFLPLLSGPVPPDYRLGPGDVLVLLLSGSVEISHTLTVSREGFVVIPQIGQLFVANLTMEQLRDLLYDRLGRVYSGVRRGPDAPTRFDISVANVRAVQVYVIGEVVQPGAYQISALGTVMTALYAAGGVTERANLRRVEVRHVAGGSDTLDLYDYLLRGDATGDVRLQSGDVIFVPVHGPRVEITGAVVRPAIYELAEGERLADLIAAAGGFRPNAIKRRVTIHRILPPAQGGGFVQRAAMDVELGVRVEHPRDGTLGDVVIPPVELLDGDSVVVDSLPPLQGGYYVTIAGEVLKPGSYPWRPGMTLRDLVRLAQGPAVAADLREAEIARIPKEKEPGVVATTLRVPLDSSYLLDPAPGGVHPGPAGVDFPPAGTAPEVSLQPFDHVTIFRQPEFEVQRTVTITGEVKQPGTYALEKKDERLSQLVTRAGGLLPSAFARGARLYRRSHLAPGLDSALQAAETPQRAAATGGAASDSLPALISPALAVRKPDSSRRRMDIELDRALREPGGWWDVALQPGDSLHVPEYIPLVQVVGAVNSPSLVQYRPGAGLDYYIAMAGGFARNADKGRVSVRYANGSARVRSKFLFFSSWPEPGPGSVVYVPVKPETTRGTDVAVIFSGLAQALGAITTMILVLNQLNSR
ncbi:Polysialic acid transport protein KpsD [bacterium HR33]|nr:Polysialic acid transport protein KpsD [bacterium HR33]